MTLAPNHKHTESVSSMQAREYIPSDTSKSAKSACIVRRIPCEKIMMKNTRINSKSKNQRHFHIGKTKHRAHYNLCVSDSLILPVKQELNMFCCHHQTPLNTNLRGHRNK